MYVHIFDIRLLQNEQDPRFSCIESRGLVRPSSNLFNKSHTHTHQRHDIAEQLVIISAQYMVYLNLVFCKTLSHIYMFLMHIHMAMSAMKVRMNWPKYETYPVDLIFVHRMHSYLWQLSVGWVEVFQCMVRLSATPKP